MPELDHEGLAADLRALGRSVPGLPARPELVDAVMARVTGPAPAPPLSARRWVPHRWTGALARHRRRMAIAVTVVLLGLLGVPAVRAAVADWFGFAGVSVRIDPAPRPSTAPPPPTITGTTALDEARRQVSFEPLVPRALGPPAGVEVSKDRRVLSMSWTDPHVGAVRLDQFDGRLDYAFAKSAAGVEFTSVGGATALWFAEPHEVVVLNADGSSRTETARLAGNTLIWEQGGSTLRLEGEFTRERAIEVAGSTVPVGGQGR